MKAYKRNTIPSETISDFLADMEEATNVAFTENRALAYRTTNNSVLDLFSTIASSRNIDAIRMGELFSVFNRAYSESKELASRMVFWLRDVRGGAGERKTFRRFLVYLARTNPKFILANLTNIPEYGRFDDLLVLLYTPLRHNIIALIGELMYKDMFAIKNNQPISLLGKWMPSENASNVDTIYCAKMIRKGLGLTSREYRRRLTFLRNYSNVLEVKMSSNKWDEIDYSKVPSRAGMLYSTAFARHNEEKYNQFLEDVALGKVDIKTSTLYPYDIVGKVRELAEIICDHGYGHSKKIDLGKIQTKRKVFNLLWNNLPDYLEGTEENILCMVDTSGSMCGSWSSNQNSIKPIDVAISLGIYTAERNKGAFENKFLTFSRRPVLQTIKGEDVYDKVMNLQKADWEGNTNIEAAFDVILSAAIRAKTDPADMISKLIIISDMQFDTTVTTNTSGMSPGYKMEKFMQVMKNKFKSAGYSMPSLVYWNVDARNGVVHATMADADFCMVSGASPSIFTGIFNGEIEVEVINEQGEKEIELQLDPIEVMKATLMAERYDKVVVV